MLRTFVYVLSLCVICAVGLAAGSYAIRPPRLTVQNTEKNLAYFGCVIAREDADDGAVYQITFLVDDVRLEFPPVNLVYPENEARLPSTVLTGQMGKMLSCRVERVLEDGRPSLGNTLVSNSYRLGSRYASGDETITECQVWYDTLSQHVTTFDGHLYIVGSEGIYDTVSDPENVEFVETWHHVGPGTSYSSFCAVALHSGMDGGGTIIIDMCDGEPVVYRCQAEIVNTFIKYGNTYELISATAITNITFVQQEDDVPDITIQTKTSVTLSGLCGDSDGDPNNDQLGMPLNDFLEYNRVPSLEESWFECPTKYYPPHPCEAIGVKMKTFDQHSYTSSDQGIYHMMRDLHDNRYIEVNRTSTGICAVAVRSGVIPSSEGHRGEIILIDKCHGTLSILKCQTEQTQPIVNNAAGVYTITTVDGSMKVQIQEMVSYIDVSTDDIWDGTPSVPPGGLCGNNDANPDNEYMNLEEFMETNRIDPKDALLDCTQYYPADVTTVSQSI